MEAIHDIDAAVNGIVGVLNVHHALLVDQAIVLRANEQLWVGAGMTTLASWLRWRCGLAPATADAIVAIAERTDDLPESIAAFRRGELSLDQMASIARRAPAWSDSQARDYAIVMTVPQLRRVLNAYPFPHLDPDGREIVPTAPSTAVQDEPATTTTAPTEVTTASSAGTATPGTEPSFTESCTMFQHDDGTYRLTALLDADTGHLVERALDEARDRLFNDGVGDVTLVDALCRVAENSLRSITDPARRSRFKVVMFVDADGSMTDTAGHRMPDSIRRHLACDSAVTPVLVENGMPVSVGRAQHIVPARTRTLIEHRDHGCCRVPGCTQTLGLEVHHIIHWEHDGPTDTWNLVLICGRHHRLHHRGRLRIAGNADRADGIEFRNEHGRIITPSGAAPKPPPTPLPTPPGVYQHPDGGRLDMSFVWFQPPAGHIRELRDRAPTDAAFLAAIAPPGS